MPNSYYREIFSVNAPFTPAPEDLDRLAAFMTSRLTFCDRAMNFETGSVIQPKADSSVPAGYTYLGQFLIHDVSLDSKTDRFRKEHNPWETIGTDDIVNERKPVFDLENIYGAEGNAALTKPEIFKPDSQTVLRLEKTYGEADKNPKINRAYLYDLPRLNGSPTADILDGRNDENFLVAQTQVAFMKFHNAVVKSRFGGEDSAEVFQKSRETVIRHFQHIILTDFLPKLVKKTVLEKVVEEVVAQKNRFYRLRPDDLYTPLEFSGCAFRVGHSVIRNSYNLNSVIKAPSATIDQLANLTGRGNMRGNGRLTSRWLLNWNWFYDIDGSRANANFNFSKRLNTKYSTALGILRPAAEACRANSLSAIDLFRASRLGLPTGQAVAAVLAAARPAGEIRILTEEEIAAKLPDTLKDVFSRDTPLLFYLLAEAESNENTPDREKLGDVGSWIVAETFVKMIYESPFSILRTSFKEAGDFLADDGAPFGMPEMLKYVQGANSCFDELNPIG